MNQEFDIIQKARHYNSHPSGVEAIEIGRHLSSDWFNAFKYIFRCDLKNGRQDIEKALYYAKDGVEHDIPVRAPSWSEYESSLLHGVIMYEPDSNKRHFFTEILGEYPEQALRWIEEMLK